MGAFFPEIPEDLREWVLAQKIFWVASAPLSPEGHVNVSPRAHDCLTIVSPNSCYYVDMTGSGNETISHLKENKRITLMWNAFEGPPRIVRFYGKGKVFERGTPDFTALLPEGDDRLLPGTRAIIWLDVHAVGSSCGFSVPFMSYEGERMTLQEWGIKREEDDAEGKKTGLQAYWADKNLESIDGLPGLDAAQSNVEKGLATISEKQREAFRLQRLPPRNPLREAIANAGVSKELLTGIVIGVGGVLVAEMALKWANVASGGDR